MKIRPWVFLVVVVVAVAPAIHTRARQTSKSPMPEPRDLVRQRQKWFYGQREFPLGKIPAGARLKAFEQMRNLLTNMNAKQSAIAAGTETSTQSASLVNAITLSQTNWTLIGPQPTLAGGDLYSGRVTALAFDSRDTTNQTIYLGGAEGGLWVTTDGGQNWTPLTDSQPSLAVGSIALDPTTNPTTIYVGTGEANFNFDAYYGAGVLKSTDGGKSWTGDTTFTPLNGSDEPMIGALAIDPSNNQILLAAVEAHGATTGGIWRSTDGGNSWAIAQAAYLGSATDVVFDPTSPGTAYGALGMSSSSNPNNGVYKSTDDGATWTPFTIPGLSPTSYGRITLAIGPQSASGKPGELLVSVADPSGSNLAGLFLTTDGGATWTQLSNTPNFCSGQCWYDMAVAIDPQNPSALYAGGRGSGTIIASTDGGSTWSRLDTSATPIGAPHGDTHAIKFSPDGSVVALGNDGGIWSTTDVGVTSNVTWSNLNNTLAITQFYPGIAIFPGNAQAGLGGTQDNGTQAYSGNLEWQEEPLCGDGGYNAITPSGLTEYVVCSAGQGLWVNNGSGWQWAANGIGTCTTTPSVCYSTLFVPPIAMDPENPSILYFGAQDQSGDWVLYQTTDGANSWQPISPGFSPPFPVETIAVAPTSSDVVYVGATISVWKTADATAGAASSWQEADAGLPGRFTTDIVVDPHSSSTAYVSFSGFSSCSYCDGMGHVYETTDGGASWTNITGDLPDTPVNALVIDPALANTIYAGTDVGAFVTTNGGINWTPLVSSLPNVAVLGLTLDPATRTLWAGTHGRSMWALQLPNAPTAVLSPTSLTFSSQDIGTSSSPQAVTLSNTGGLALAITSIYTSDGFTQTNNCGTMLAGESSCTINVTFAPNAAGTITGTLSISDGLASSPQTVALNGTGVAVAGVTLSPQSLTFGSQDVGSTSSPQSVTLTNTGSAQLNISSIGASGPFTETDNCGSSVQPNADCTVNVSFAPTAGGSASGTLTVTDDAASSPQTVALSGTGATVPVVTLAPSTVDFHSMSLGASSSVTDIQLTNSGSATLNISSITLTGANPSQFALVAPGSGSPACSFGAASLNAGSSCFFGVEFQPTVEGNLSASVSVTDNAADSPQRVGLSGTGLGPAVTLKPQTLTFTSQNVGTTSAAQSVTLTDTGTYRLNISSISASGPFSETNDCGTSVFVNASCTINVTFTPTAAGAASGTLTVSDDASNSPQTVALSGTGVAPAVTLSPQTLIFSSQAVGTTSAAQPVTLTNTGGAQLNISSIAASVPFSETNNCGSSVQPGASCTINVTFTPTAAGAASGTLTVSDDASNSPQTVALSGTGVVPTAKLTPQTLTFSNQEVGTTSTAQPVTLTNTGSAQLNISSIAASSPFSETNNCGTSVQVNASCTINVTFAPTAAGSSSGTVTITDDASTSPETVTLSGTGIAPAAKLTPQTLTFSNQDVGTTSTVQTVTLANTGSAQLNISSIATSSPFSEANNCGSSVQPGANCTINVTFAPAAAGSDSGAVTISDNAFSSAKQTVTLSGNGQDFKLAASPASASVGAGSSAGYTITVGAQGEVSFASPVSLTCQGLPSLASCVFSPASVTPGPGSASSTLTITTTASSLLLPGTKPEGRDWKFPALWLGLLVVLAALAALSRKKAWKPGLAIASCAMLLCLVAPAVSCNGGGGGGATSTVKNPGTPAGTYSVTVTGKSGQLQHSTTLTLTVD